jgi:hypothetical protein
MEENTIKQKTNKEEFNQILDLLADLIIDSYLAIKKPKKSERLYEAETINEIEKLLSLHK